MAGEDTIVTAAPRTHSLLPHVAALALVMAILLPVIGWHGVFSSDEGAGIAQARALSKGGSFALQHPFPAADPARASFAYEKSAATKDGYFPLPKRFTYSTLLAGADEVAGVPGMIVLSIAGTVAAALFAALLARRVDPSLGPLTFWLTGLASPLFADGYLVIAHSIGAAVAAAALLAVHRATQRPSASRVALVAALVALASLLRAEAVLFGVALTLTLALLSWRRRDPQLAAVSAASFVGVTTGWALDHALTSHVIGSGAIAIPAAGGQGAAGGGVLIGRLQGFIVTWLRPGYGSATTSWVLLIAISVIGLLAIRETRRPEPDARAVRGLSVVVASLAVVVGVSYSLPTPHIVPGLLIAFPAGVWGLAALQRATLRSPTVELLVLTWGLFAVAVLATQYAKGGGWEWGGRYFALGLPSVTPLVAAGLRDAGRRVDRQTAGFGLAAIVAASLAVAAMGVGSVRYFREHWGDFVDAVGVDAAQTTAGDGGAPVVVTTEPEVPRAAWDEMDASRWLLVSRAAMPEMLARLDRLGIKQLIIITKGPGLIRSINASRYSIDGSAKPPEEGAWWVHTLSADDQRHSAVNHSGLLPPRGVAGRHALLDTS